MHHRPELDTRADRIVSQLAYRYDGLFERDRIDTLFHDSYDRLAETARVTVFLPTLAEKLTVQRLDALAQAEGKVAKKVPEVLFVCVGNAGRSQMAAALTRRHAGTRLLSWDGGTGGVGVPIGDVAASVDERQRLRPLIDCAVREQDA